MTDDIRWRGPRPDSAAQAATDASRERAATRGREEVSSDGGAPEEAKRPSRRRRRRGRGGKSGAKAVSTGSHDEAAGATRAPNAGHDAGGANAAARGGAEGEARSSQARDDAKRHNHHPDAKARHEPQPAAKRRGRGAARRRRGPIYAALDLGTNNCRLLVARAEGEGFQILDAFSRVVRLGEGLSESGRLSDAAIDRSVTALSICADRLAKYRATRLRAIATEACRRAANQDAFIERVRAETGIPLEVIPAEEEARLAVAGCAPLLDPKADELLVFDIGGGSTELIWVDLSRTSPPKRRALLMALAQSGERTDRARAAASHVRDWVSIPVGVVTLGELFDRMIDDEEKFAAMNDHVAALLAPFQARIGETGKERLARLQILGTSGTITTLAGVHLDLERYSRRAVDGLWIASGAVERVIDRLLSLNAYERRRIPCVGEDRATNLMAGAAILRAILRAWPTQRLRVADRGLREGMLYGLMQQYGGGRRRKGGPQPSEPTPPGPAPTGPTAASAAAEGGGDG